MIPNILFRKVDMGNIGLIIKTIIMLLLSIVGNNNKHAVRGNSNGNPASNPREFAIRIGRSARHSS
jgi:hypothetical protein